LNCLHGGALQKNLKIASLPVVTGYMDVITNSRSGLENLNGYLA
jgi:hypothetical protein